MATAILMIVMMSASAVFTQAQVIIPESFNRSIEMKLAGRGGENVMTGAGSIVNLQRALSNEMRQINISSISGLQVEIAVPLPPLANAIWENGKNEKTDKNDRNDPGVNGQPLPDHSADQEIWQRDSMHGFQWGSAFKQSLLFLGIQHGFRLATEEGSRADLKGPFFKDYWKSLTSLKGWTDGDPFIVNYIGHPMMGAVSGYIQIQNDPNGIDEKLSLSRSYWISRLKAMGWSAAYSTQFELGLVSEATLGNIGIRPYGKAKNPMAYVDLVVTPVVGTGWIVGEDALDQYFIRRIERRLPNRTTLVLVRSFLNPTRSFANIMRGKWPWHRDDRQ